MRILLLSGSSRVSRDKNDPDIFTTNRENNLLTFKRIILRKTRFFCVEKFYLSNEIINK